MGMRLAEAIAVIEAHGLTIRQKAVRKARVNPLINCLGLSRSPSFDPNYKIKTPLTSINRLRADYSYEFRQHLTA